MQFFESNGIELRRIRLSQSSPYEPISARLETAWQNENDLVEVFLLTEVVEGQPGRDNAESAAASPAADAAAPKPAASHDPAHDPGGH
jgi:hypothetical protein